MTAPGSTGSVVIPTVSTADRIVGSLDDDARWRRTVFAAALAIWTALAVVSTLDALAYAHFRGEPAVVWRAVFQRAPRWYFWALATPGIMWLANRAPFRRGALPRALAAHAPALLALHLLFAAMVVVVNLTLYPGPSSYGTGELLLFALIDWFPASLVAYAAIVAATYALDYVRRFRAVQLRAATLDGQLAQAQLAALRSQLHPHFLFNTLNTAVSLVRIDDRTTAVRVLTELGDMLRHALASSEAGEVRLREELAFVERYLAIERLRSAHRIRGELRVPDEALDALVPSLLLQPLVENAIRHGLAPRDAGGTVRIVGAVVGDTLRLTIEDDGVGVPAGWTPERSAGIGLRNSAARLARMYDGAARLTTERAAEGGVIVTVSLPLRRAPAARDV